MKRMKKLAANPFIWVSLSALLSALPYSIPALFFLSWFSFVPLILVLFRRENRTRRDLGMGFLFGFLYHLFTYWWFYVLYPMESAGFSKPVAVLVVLIAWVGISLAHGALFMLPGLGLHLAKKKLSSRPLLGLVFLSFFLLAEWITELGELAFPWIRVSLGQFRVPVLLQGASLFGVYGTDLLILGFNVLLALVLVSSPKRRVLYGSLAGVLFLSNLTFGLVRMALPEDGGETITVAAIQGNILSGEKWGPGSTQFCIDTYASLTKAAAEQKPDLVVWAESAVPVTLNRSSNESVLEGFQTLSEEIDAPIFMGTLWQIEQQSANAAVLISAGEVGAPYVKRHLVPFGETVPYRPFVETCLPFLTEINMLSDDLAVGQDPVLVEVEQGKIGGIICFESIFPALVRESVQDGAGLLAVVTNDSWYEDSPAVYQHLSHAVLRSIENGRATVRAANSGVSALIDARGRIPQELGPLQRGAIGGELTFSQEKTLYTQIGDVVLPALWIVTALWSLGSLLWERRQRRAKR